MMFLAVFASLQQKCRTGNPFHWLPALPGSQFRHGDSIRENKIRFSQTIPDLLVTQTAGQQIPLEEYSELPFRPGKSALKRIQCFLIVAVLDSELEIR